MPAKAGQPSYRIQEVKEGFAVYRKPYYLVPGQEDFISLHATEQEAEAKVREIYRQRELEDLVFPVLDDGSSS